MLDSSLTSMPIPCVDVVLEKKANVLLGFRAIPPYRASASASIRPSPADLSASTLDG